MRILHARKVRLYDRRFNNPCAPNNFMLNFKLIFQKKMFLIDFYFFMELLIALAKKKNLERLFFLVAFKSNLSYHPYTHAET